MRAALLTEYRKLVTTRLWWILLLCMAVYMAFLAAVLGWGITQGGGMAGPGPGGGEDDLVLAPDAVVRAVYTIAVTFGYVFPLLVGALAVASEFRHQTITPTLLAEPRRTLLLSAKLVSAGIVGLVYGIVGTLASVGAGAAVLTLLDQPTFLDQASTWRTIALSVLALALWAVVGVGFGSVLTNQVAVIVVVLAFTQFVEPVLRFVLALTSWGADVAAYLPGAAGEAVSGGSFYSETGVGSLLEWWQGALVLVAYGVGLAAIGRVTTFRRDIT
ncbi:ABC transporter permease [Cellulomonas terrae]|uniref:ABC transporter permease n=1 Tax=Cellulomonas terrae TaxID=311234 RepID=A0A511JKX1_9CELL|nr:ABC transporter permease [Cellulomonas terrae]GEL98596.1 ABC transporter permease [Cellulomonas terrae]